MNNLSAFLKQNAFQNETIRFVASKRFCNEEGIPVEWEISSITSEEDEAIRKACTRKVQVPGKKNQFTPETDYNLYLGRLAAKCTVYPNLNNAELQNSYGCMGADSLLKAMLKPGEYADFIAKIQEINGFDVSMEELVDEAKNS
ncbi:phage XkdN-like protein [Ruminiclostridium hungatei]|uniref:Phage XkdN-like protein n=1 Tax=Ruminiclostridium hungatei TaxID=48256 RepID=A0A1V4SIX0_RUMHU|nr:phage portal protein [Ruminiclostridium hungatei]OPX43829.1 phage XkdN-like protein [Ruminiclostridium hungatei]